MYNKLHFYCNQYLSYTLVLKQNCTKKDEFFTLKCWVRFLVDADTVEESIAVYYTNTCYMQELYATLLYLH